MRDGAYEKSWRIYKLAVSRFPDRRFEFREKWGAYRRPLEVAKNSHMRGPVGNTAFRGRPRADPHLQALCEHMGCAVNPVGCAGFRENMEKIGNVNKL